MPNVLFYLVYDKAGHVGDFIPHHLQAVRDHYEHIFVVSNSPLSAEGRSTLEAVADTVWERENVGFDVMAYRDAMREFGWDRLAGYDELTLMNYTFYGPIGSYQPMLERMAATECDFWGVTDHGPAVSSLAATGTLKRHLQTHWITVRRSMHQSPAWREYWDGMPPIESYEDSIGQHEGRFTDHFESKGFRSATAFPEADYPVAHPIFDMITEMVDDGLPIIKRRLFFHDPLYHDERAIRAGRVIERMRNKGFPMRLLWEDQARTAQPRALHANLAMLDIHPDVDLGGADPSTLRVGVLAHVYYDDLIDELLDRADTIPGGYRLIATTSDDAKRERILERLAARGRTGDDVRVLPSNRGRDISAFLLGCRDVLLGDEFDVIVKLHSKRSPQDGYTKGTFFKDHLLLNLLGSPGYTANVLRGFAADDTLGMVFPPMIHMGYPTMGNAWFTNRAPAQRLAKRLGIDVEFDDLSPLAPYGSMFIARPAALRPLLDADFAWDDFPTEGGYSDGGLTHVVERLFGYAAFSRGYQVRTVMGTRQAAESHTMLEYKLDAISAGIPGAPEEQIARVRANSGIDLVAALKLSMLGRSPRLAKALVPAYAAMRGGYRNARRVLKRR
ncbi:MAG: rhamnan synthesis F family protein [Actinomycetes bacterium]